MTAVIQKSSGTCRNGFYVICKELVDNRFFSTYLTAKEYCLGKGWNVMKI